HLFVISFSMLGQQEHLNRNLINHENTKIKTTIITICALSYNLTAQASPSYRPRDRVNKTMIELQTNGVERQLLDNSCGISSGVFK
ncbi:hypothetical protein U4W23_26325, partial [Escherichia coli]|nr:hypothetical protein [Escherichia coli]